MVKDIESVLETPTITTETLRPFITDPEISVALDGLHAYQIEATQTEGQERLQKVCQDFTLARVHPKVYTSFFIEEHPPENWRDDENTVFVPVIHGWLSAGMDEIAQGKDGKSLIQRIVATVQEQIGADTRIIIISVPTIGFNGAEFTDEEDFNENFVGMSGYSDYVEAMIKALDIPEEKAIFFCHSMAGRVGMELKNRNSKREVVLANPAVEAPEEIGKKEKVGAVQKGRTTIATIRASLATSETNRILDESQRDLFSTLADLIEAGQEASKVPFAGPTFVSKIQGRIIVKLQQLFLNVDPKDPSSGVEFLRKQYTDMLENHWRIACAMARKLAEREIRPNDLKRRVQILVADRDNLVTTRTAGEFVSQWLDALHEWIQTSPYPWLGSIPLEFLREQLVRKTKGGHCNIFVEPEAGQIAANEVARSIRIQRLKNDPERVAEIEGFLKKQEGWIAGFADQESTDRYLHLKSLFGLWELEEAILQYPEELEDIAKLPDEEIAKVLEALNIRKYDVNENTREQIPLEEKTLLGRAARALLSVEKSRETTNDRRIIMKASLFGLPLDYNEIEEITKGIYTIYADMKMTPPAEELYPDENLSTLLKMTINNGINAIRAARKLEESQQLSEKSRKKYELMRRVFSKVQPFTKMTESLLDSRSALGYEGDYQDLILAVLEHLMSKK